MKSMILITALALATAAWAIPEGPADQTPEWEARETANFARTSEAPNEQNNPAFQQRLQQQNTNNQASWTARAAADPSWLDPRSGNSEFTPLCTSWMEQCAGDPFRYPEVDGFYETEGEVIPFFIYDAECARISGRVWAPVGSSAADNLPAVVIETGSVQAPEPLYWWMAQALVRQGYVTLTFDVRGQGRSDFQTPTGGQGGNSNSSVFFEGLVNVIDFFRSSPGNPYPHNETCADTYPTVVTDFNPFHDRIDASRLGLAGHSLGASGVTGVQAFGAEGEDPWPGLIDSENPVDVIVAWDSLSSGFTPRVPAMGQSSEYGLTPAKKTVSPDPEQHKGAYDRWVEAGLPVWQATIQGSTHYEWSLIPTFPTTSWCPNPENGDCAGGWGRPFAEHYSVAWFDRWLKLPGEPGYADADARLLAESDFCQQFSFYYRSAYQFPDRQGVAQSNEDVRASCLTAVALLPEVAENQSAQPGESVQAGRFTITNDGAENRTVDTVVINLSNPEILDAITLQLPDGSEIEVQSPSGSNEIDVNPAVTLTPDESGEFQLAGTVAGNAAAAMQWGQPVYARARVPGQMTVPAIHVWLLMLIPLAILTVVSRHRVGKGAGLVMIFATLLTACGTSEPDAAAVDAASSTSVTLSRVVTGGNSGQADIAGLPIQLVTIVRQ